MRSWLVSWSLALLLLALLAALPQSALALSASQVYEQVQDSVVVKAYDQKGKPVGLGSGVMLPSGDIITNYHVVKAGVLSLPGRNGLPDEVDKILRVYDLGSMKLLKRKMPNVASDEVIRPGFQGAFQKLVVGRIAAQNIYRNTRGNP